MNRIQTKAMLLTSIGFLAGLAPHVFADEWDQKTILTFNSPVEIPGRVLAPGAYVFKLADSSSDRNILQVFNRSEEHLYGTFLTIPDRRLRPAGTAITTFDEHASGSPEAVRAWFYPGEGFGHQFVYPKQKALALARANNITVPSMPDELAAYAMDSGIMLDAPHVIALKRAPLKAQMPDEQEIEIADALPEEAPPAAQRPAELPETASELPLIGVIGVLSLVAAIAALGLRLASKRRDF